VRSFFHGGAAALCGALYVRLLWRNAAIITRLLRSSSSRSFRDGSSIKA